LGKSQRCCSKCKRSLEECMGYVKAGDVLELQTGGTRLRELCGLCVIVWSWARDGTIIRREA